MRIPNSNTESLHSMFIARFMTRPESAKENCRAGKIGNEIYSSDVLRVFALQCYSRPSLASCHPASDYLLFPFFT